MLVSLLYFLVRRILGAGGCRQAVQEIELLVLRHQLKVLQPAGQADSTHPHRPGPAGGETGQPAGPDQAGGRTRPGSDGQLATGDGSAVTGHDLAMVFELQATPTGKGMQRRWGAVKTSSAPGAVAYFEFVLPILATRALRPGWRRDLDRRRRTLYGSDGTSLCQYRVRWLITEGYAWIPERGRYRRRARGRTTAAEVPPLASPIEHVAAPKSRSRGTFRTGLPVPASSPGDKRRVGGRRAVVVVQA